MRACRFGWIGLDLLCSLMPSPSITAGAGRGGAYLSTYLLDGVLGTLYIKYEDSTYSVIQYLPPYAVVMVIGVYVQ